MSRRERRARTRRDARAAAKTPVLIAGDGIIAAALGDRFEARPSRDLPPKVPGRHRWIATGAWVITVEDVEHADEKDWPTFLDNENLMQLGIGCWDCEQPLGVIAAGSVCPAPGE